MLGHGPGHAAALKALKGAGVKTPSGGAAGLAKAAGLHGVPGAHAKAVHAVLPQRRRCGTCRSWCRCTRRCCPGRARGALPRRSSGGGGAARLPRCAAGGARRLTRCCGRWCCGGCTDAAPVPPRRHRGRGRRGRHAGPAVFIRRRRRRASAVDAAQPAGAGGASPGPSPVGRGAGGPRAGDLRRRGGCGRGCGSARRWHHGRFCRSAAHQPEPVGAWPLARALFASGSADPRLLSVLSNAVSHHTIVLGDAESVVDPVHAQAVDIVAVDGQPVGPANVAARDPITDTQRSTRASADEIGTPWPIESPGFLTDPAQAGRRHPAFVSIGRPSAVRGPGAVPLRRASGRRRRCRGRRRRPGSGPPPSPVAAGAPRIRPRRRGQGGRRAGSAVADLPPPADGRCHRGWRRVNRGACLRAINDRQAAESAGNNLGPQLDKFEAEFGYHGAPWCGIFVGHALQAAGLKVPHTVASVAAILDLARSGDGLFQKGSPGQRDPARRPCDVRRHRARRDRHPRRCAGHPHDRRQHRAVKRQRDDLLPSSVTGVVRPKYGVAPHEATAAATAGGAGAAPPAAMSPRRGVPGPARDACPPGAAPTWVRRVQGGRATWARAPAHGPVHGHVQPSPGSPLSTNRPRGGAAGHDAGFRAAGLDQQPAGQGPGIGVAPSGGRSLSAQRSSRAAGGSPDAF